MYGHPIVNIPFKIIGHGKHNDDDKCVYVVAAISYLLYLINTIPLQIVDCPRSMYQYIVKKAMVVDDNVPLMLTLTNFFCVSSTSFSGWRASLSASAARPALSGTSSPASYWPRLV